eukprot:TRINITY_DN28138_c0_g2_i1.p1 TRINITY_DN28138_c0_g2~~TRINITY_DN28138_c0_g2_i1.p1  ORF type:complete len:348 (+),score=82.38 TRINITY_DN28138_c0_g2_i1:93-1136(+)
MGNEACSARHSCCAVKSAKNEPVTGTADYDKNAPKGSTHIIIVSMNYKNTNRPLTSSRDGKNMEDLAKTCGVEHVWALHNESCTKMNVLMTIKQVGKECKRGDTVVFFYSGHGQSVQDLNGDEEDGYDEAFVLMTPHGGISQDSLLTDDEFADTMLDCIPRGVKVIVLTDACHSGSIADLTKEGWEDRPAISISGCRDWQEAADMGAGGIFTHSMLLAIEKLGTNSDYSVGKLFNATMVESDRIFKEKQDLTIHCSQNMSPNLMAWPLVPSKPYRSPLTQAKQADGHAQFKIVHRGVDIGDYKDVPDDLANWAKDNNIDLGDSYEDEELENGWKKGAALLKKINDGS